MNEPAVGSLYNSLTPYLQSSSIINLWASPIPTRESIYQHCKPIVFFLGCTHFYSVTFPNDYRSCDVGWEIMGSIPASASPHPLRHAHAWYSGLSVILSTMLLPSTLTLTPLVHSGTRFPVRWQSHVQYHSDYRKCERYPEVTHLILTLTFKFLLILQVAHRFNESRCFYLSR